MKGARWKLEENFQRMEHWVREGAKSGAQLVIVPESILDGYICCTDRYTTKEKMLAVAQSVPDGAYVTRARALARELRIYLIFGFLERSGGELYNTCMLLDPQGEIIGKYRKVNPSEESYITPGHELKPIDTPLGRVAFLICSDRWVPENFRVLSVLGAQIILIPMDGVGGSEHTQMLRQRALDNYCWIIVANTWCCTIVDPKGKVWLEKYDEECITTMTLALLDPLKDLKRDRMISRRPDLYAALTQSHEAHKRYDERGMPTPFEEERRRQFLLKVPVDPVNTKGNCTTCYKTPLPR
jgi:predicted amidohydrolase